MTLEAAAATVRRGGRRLLDRVDAAVLPGTLTAVLGPNGAGKTTLLRVLAGEIAPQEGRVALDGVPLARWPSAALARRRAVLPQSSQLALAFTVAEVAALGRLPHGEGGGESPVVAAALRLAGVAEFADRVFPSLSGGEKQRAQLARVLAQLSIGQAGGPPRYALLDEPVSALDLPHQHAVMRVARALARDGHGVLAILHDANLALRYADRAILMREGRVVAAGAAGETLVPARMAPVFGIGFARLPAPDPPGHILLAAPEPAAGERA